MSTGPTYRIEFKPTAAKAIRKLPTDVRARIQARIRTLASDPRPHNCVKLADQHGLYRVRTGDYRVIYRVQDDRLVVCVLDVGDRKDVYKGL